MRGLILACLAMSAPAAAVAQPVGEVALRHQLRSDPDDRMAMANLARLYVQSGQTTKAHRLYRGLLGLENVALERAGGGAVWSHRLAQDAMRTHPVRPGTALTAR